MHIYTLIARSFAHFDIFFIPLYPYPLCPLDFTEIRLIFMQTSHNFPPHILAEYPTYLPLDTLVTSPSLLYLHALDSQTLQTRSHVGNPFSVVLVKVNVMGRSLRKFGYRLVEFSVILSFVFTSIHHEWRMRM